jgi:predicted ATPase
MHAVFVSYAHADKDVADAVCAKIEGAEIGCWIAPRDAAAGVNYPGQIVEAIAAAQVLVLVLSSHSMHSRQVRSEVERAFSKGIPIIPLRVEDVLPQGDFEYLIGSVHWLDAMIGPLEPRLDELLATVRARLAGEKPDAPALRETPNNLPAPVNRLIGRAADVTAIGDRLAQDRLVTVTGAGGVGKTRVAVEVGSALLRAWRDGVWFVQLASIEDPALVTNAIAQGVGTPEGPDRPLRELLIEHLKDKRLLLLLDNCEHVVAETGAVVSATLQHCAQVHVLATSRESLKVGGEWTYRLPALGLSPPDVLLSVPEAEAIPAIGLFVERARATDARFILRAEDVAAVADICRRLDGIPFAVELAAARVSVLGPRQLATRLTERFRLLRGGDRDALPHQQTMRACIDWSYDMLADAERTLFARMAIFPAGCTLDAAEIVCAGDAVDRDDILDLLSSLVNKSLAFADLSFENPRYRLLESTREYALEKLAERGEDQTIARKHADWIAKLVTEAREAGAAAPVHRVLADVMPEADSMRAALGWALGPGDDVALAATLAAKAATVWLDGGLQAEGRQWLETILSRIDDQTQPVIAAGAWLTLSGLYYAQRLVDAAKRSIGLFERVGDVAGAAQGQLQLAYGFWQVGDLAAAEAAVERSLALHRDAGLERTWQYANALNTKGSIILNVGRLIDAERIFEEALERSAAVGDDHGFARAQVNLAELKFALDKPEDALRLAKEALANFHHLGAGAREANLAVNVASYQLALGMTDEAERSALMGLDLARETGQPVMFMVAVLHLATVASLRGNSERAARLLGYVDAWCAREGFEHDRGERIARECLWSALTANLGAETLALLSAAGARLGEGEAALLARQSH